MAEALSEEQPLVEHATGRREGSAFRGRFRLAYAALAAILWVAVAVLAVVLSRDGSAPQRPWSAWEPQARSSLDRAGEIAAHVAPLYRTGAGAQLVGIQAHLPEVQNQPQNVPVEAVAVRGGLSGQEIDGRPDLEVGLLPALRPRQGLRDRRGRAVRLARRAAPPRGARARALHLRVRGGRLRGRVPAARDRRGRQERQLGDLLQSGPTSSGRSRSRSRQPCPPTSG